MTTAPVCHVPADQTLPPQPKGTKLPVVPVAVDLPTAIQAINALKLIIQMITGQAVAHGAPNLDIAFANTSRPGAGAGGTTPNQLGATTQSALGRWREVPGTRVTQKVRVTGSNGAYVDILRINGITMQDSVTGESFLWNRT